MAVLELTNISKHFGAIHAVNDVSFSIEPGEVVGLMGDNGAGKSTLVKMIAGNYRPTEGSMKMDGAELVLHKPVDARRHGIEIVHQDLALCNNLTAAANVFLGRELRKGVGPFSVLDYASMYRRAGEIFKELKSETRPRDLVKQMSGGQRQAVAIGRTMLSEAKIVLMDEPTAAISVRQVAEVLNLIRELREQGHRRRVDQPSHARRVRRGRSRDRHAARQEGRGQADCEELTRGGHGVDHRRDRASGVDEESGENGYHHP